MKTCPISSAYNIALSCKFYHRHTHTFTYTHRKYKDFSSGSRRMYNVIMSAKDKKANVYNNVPIYTYIKHSEFMEFMYDTICCKKGQILGWINNKLMRVLENIFTKC